MQESLQTLKSKLTPEQYAAFLKQQGEFFWWEPDQIWVVTRAHLAKEALTHKDLSADRGPYFITRMPELNPEIITDFFGAISQMMVMSDPPKHQQRRRICYHGFTHQRIQSVIPILEREIQRILSGVRDGGEIEVVSTLAEQIPSLALAEFFEIPHADQINFYRWSHTMTMFFGGEATYNNASGREVNEAAVALRDYFVQLINKRRQTPSDDFMSVMLMHQQDLGLSDQEVISQAMMMLVAGQITTTDQFCNNLYQLLTHSKLQQKLTQNPQHLSVTNEELTRFDPAVTYLFRRAERDTTLGNYALKKEDVVFISTHAANRDPEIFKEPGTFIWDRHPNPHFSYGFGAHFCLGAKLARIEMEIMLRMLLTQYPNMTLHPEKGAQRKHQSLAFSGFTQLWLQL